MPGLAIKGVETGRGLDRNDNISSKYGTDPTYLTRRIKRDHPEIFAKLDTYPSVRKAAIAAGIVKPPTPLVLLRRAWEKASPDERMIFLGEVVTVGPPPADWSE